MSIGWNEIVVDGRGNAYINGGGFNPLAGEKFASGIIAMVTPDGSNRQVADARTLQVMDEPSVSSLARQSREQGRERKE